MGHRAVQHFRKPRGFGVIEILVALGIVTIVMFGFMGFYLSANITSARLDQNLELAQIDYGLNQILINQEACTKSFKDQNVASLTATNNLIQVNFPNAATPLVQEAKEITTGISVSRSRASFRTLSAANNIYMMSLTIEYSKKNLDDSLKLRSRTLNIPLVIPLVAGVRKILSCSPSSNRAAFDIPTVSCTALPNQFLTGITDDMRAVCAGVTPCSAYPGSITLTKDIILSNPRCIVGFTGCKRTVVLDTEFPASAGNNLDAIFINDSPFSGFFVGPLATMGCTGRKKDILLTTIKPKVKKTFFTLNSTLTFNPVARTVEIDNKGYCKNPGLCGPCIDHAVVTICHRP